MATRQGVPSPSKVHKCVHLHQALCIKGPEIEEPGLNSTAMSILYRNHLSISRLKFNMDLLCAQSAGEFSKISWYFSWSSVLGLMVERLTHSLIRL